MVILSSSGFQNKEKMCELKKTVKNKKVYVCTNAIEKQKDKDKVFDLIKENIQDTTAKVDQGELTTENINRYIEYYDCIYLAEGDLRRLNEMLSHKQIKEGLLKFIDNGRLFITEGLSGHIASDNLHYLNFILQSLDEEDKIYKFIDYSNLITLDLSKEKYLFHANKLVRKFQGACKLAEKNYRTSIIRIDDGDFVVL